jgi:hypothetical protein
MRTCGGQGVCDGYKARVWHLHSDALKEDVPPDVFVVLV